MTDCSKQYWGGLLRPHYNMLRDTSFAVVVTRDLGPSDPDHLAHGQRCCAVGRGEARRTPLQAYGDSPLVFERVAGPWGAEISTSDYQDESRGVTHEDLGPAGGLSRCWRPWRHAGM
jgi:hypothetical protein